ncbi:MAG: hypothetical protein CL766_02180 [Chloroflexi bacterium]|nr:hypothetical protein [Chloroflexota bacterium]
MKNKLKILSIITVMSLLVGAFGILPAAAATVSVADNTAEWTNQDGEAVTHVKPDTVGVFWVNDSDLETTKTGVARWYPTARKNGPAAVGASWNIGTGGLAATETGQEVVTSSQHYITATHYNASNATKTPLTAAPTVKVGGVTKLVTGFDTDGQFTLGAAYAGYTTTTATFTYHIQDLYYGTSTSLRRAKVTSTSDPSGEYITINEDFGPGAMGEGLDGTYRIHATSTGNAITGSGLITSLDNVDGRGTIVDRDGNGTVDGGDVTVVIEYNNADITLASSSIASVNPSTGAITFATAQTTTATTTVYYQSSVSSATSDLYRGDLQLSSNASAQGTNSDGIWVQDGDTVTITYLNSSGTAIDTDTVTVDAVVPTISNISPADGSTQNVVNPTVQFDVTDTGSGISSTNVSTDISININGTDITSTSPSFQAITNGFRVIFASGSSWVTSYSVADSTAFTWTIVATDVAKNTKRLHGSSLDLTIDTTKPTVSSAVTGTSWSTDTAAEGTAESNTSVKVTLSENILSSSVQATDFTVGGVAPTAAVVGSTTGYKNIIYLTVAAQDPDARPVVAVTGSVTDIGGNAVNTASTTAGDYSATATDGLKPGLTVAVSSDLLIAAGKTTVTADTTEKLGTDGTIISIHGPSGASNAGKATISAPTPKQSTGSFTAATGDLTGKYGVSVQATDLGANTKDNLTAVTAEAVASAKISGAVVTVAKTPIADSNFDGVINASDITSITFATSSQTSSAITAVDASAGTITFGSNFGTSETATVSYKYTTNTFEVDHSAPTITYLPANASTIKVSSPYITITFDEDEYPGDSYKTVTLTKAEVTKPDASVEDLLTKFVTSDNAEYIWAASDLALGKYTLKISGTDTAGNKITDSTSSFTVAARDLYSISLRPGWNLISLPGDPTDSAVNTVITDADIDTVISYDPTVAGSWTTAVRNAAGQLEGTLTNVVAGKGYWVHTSTFDPIKVDIPGLTAGASTLPPSFSLVAGWNLVSAGTLTLTQTTRDADEYFAGLSWSRAYSYSNTTNAFTSILPDASNSDDTDISIGQGYWLFLKAAGTLVP